VEIPGPTCRHGRPEAKLFGDLMDHYMEDVVTMFRIIRDRDSG